jgi:hypothetical protein
LPDLQKDWPNLSELARPVRDKGKSPDVDWSGEEPFNGESVLKPWNAMLAL